MPSHDDWVATLRDLGLPATRVLGSGMEGTVVDLDDGSVAKVWSSRTGDELRRLQAFYDAVVAAGLPLAVPRVLEVLAVGDRWATRQPRLDGEPLWQQPGVSPPPDDGRVDAVVEVLAALASVEPVPALAVLPVLEGEPAFDPARPFGSSLADLVERRAGTHHAALAARMPDLDKVVAALTDRLRALPPARPALLHGDLVPGNVLVAGGAPVAVLDFGFLSTVGDPAFDAAVAASVFDMYGAEAARCEERLDRAVADRFGYDEQRLGLYRAAYALVTANCFSASGSDGHFDWCMRMLARPSIRASLAG